jgi:uncharacterized membrane protein
VSTPATQARNLYKWLEIATAELIPPSGERIRLEIEAHFADSVESHQANGCSEAEAHAAVLAELGDPIEAAKRFRRRHLTEKDAKQVRQMLNVGGIARLLAWYAMDALFYIYFLYFLKGHHLPLGFIAAALIMLAALQTSCFFVARPKGSKPDIRLLALTHVFYDGCFVVILTLMAVGTSWAGVSVGLIALCLNFIRNLRLWFKLGQVETIWPEMPSRGAPAP